MDLTSPRVLRYDYNWFPPPPPNLKQMKTQSNEDYFHSQEDKLCCE